jgi:hypothetical protein
MVPGAPAGPIRYVTYLPADSLLEGWAEGQEVYFLKSYQGAHYGGFKVGDRLVGEEITDHTVHYQGRLSADGTEIEGQWWIEARPGRGSRRTEGGFRLRRRPVAEAAEADRTVAFAGPRGDAP